LPDSSWYIARAKARRDPLLELAELALMRDIATCGIVVSEVGRGIRDRKVLNRYLASWREMFYISSSRAVWDGTLELAWQLDRQGRVLPVQDLLIAACALAIDAVVLTCDSHFQDIPGIDATDRIL
jgi:predicted nucleic acid-binding protein